VGAIHLLALPMALNLDQKPGADGVAVKVFATDPRGTRSVSIREGCLEILAYEGRPDPVKPGKPFHTWTYSPAELAPRAYRTSIGPAYDLVLSWIPKTVRTKFVTVTARYTPPSGRAIVAAPSVIQAVTVP